MAGINFRPQTLELDTRFYPTPRVKMLDASTLSGGLNIADLDYKLDIDQSPDMENMYWKEGVLCARGGQDYLYKALTSNDPYGAFYACYDREWLDGYMICHKGSAIYKVALDDGAHTALVTGVYGQGGTFFVYGDKLYYMNGHDYIQVDKYGTASFVVPYIPKVVINRYPDGTNSRQYQPENRLASGKEVWFTAHKSGDAWPAEYNLPYTELEPDAVTITAQIVVDGVLTSRTYVEVQSYASRPATGVPGVIYLNNMTSPTAAYSWNGTAYVSATVPAMNTTFTVNREEGTVTFNTAPNNTAVEFPNNVKIILYRGDEATKQSILSCRCVTVFGTGTINVIVCGGPSAQPNAYFWNGNNDVQMDASYFPFDSYNFAGTPDTFVTGFGKQQNMLIIFKERSIAKSSLSTQTIDEREYINFSHTAVNSEIGCDMPGSICLIMNNLVFANTYSGVYMLLDTTAAGENTVTRLSRNVNGDPETRGLLHDLRSVSANAVSSFNDGDRYWLSIGGSVGHVYVWDYRLRFVSTSYSYTEKKLSWFFFTNIYAKDWFKTIDSEANNRNVIYYGKADGSIVQMVEEFYDFKDGDDFLPIYKKYTLATQNFDTYEVLKDVLKVIIAARSDTNSVMDITYKTDYETRKDLTPVRSYTWALVPRNLAYRYLGVRPFAGAFVRVPRCFHVRHFSLTLENNEPLCDMSLIGMQIQYRISKEDR